VTNALGQHTLTLAYGSGITFGYGEWLQSGTDANNQATTYQYDVLGRLTGLTKPGETAGDLTTQYVYTIWRPAPGASTPCSEEDTIQRYDSSTTVTTRAFYDGWGKVAETRVPVDSSHDVVTYTTYDAREEAIFTSRPYYVGSGSGYSAPDSTQLGSSAVYDAAGRQTQNTDPAGAMTTTSYLQVTGPDSATYLGTQVVDANHHQIETLTDPLGHTRYDETFTGTSSPYTLYATTSQAYDFQGNLVTITHPDGTHTTTTTYDLAGRKTGVSDPDLGSMTYQLDSDGNVTQQTDARGDTVYLGYDALDRQLWRNTTNSPTGAYVTYSYDGTAPSGVSCSGITPGSNAIGHVTTEQFTSGPANSFSGSYCFGYDARGELIGQTDTLAGATYLPTLSTYNDAGVVTRLTYPTQEYEQDNFSAQERLISVTRSARGTTNYLIPSITYNGPAGPSGKPDSYVLTGTGPCSASNSSTVCVSLSYDADLRLTAATFTHPTSSTPITDYSTSVSYDAVGNVTSVSSALPAAGGQSGGQDNQQFCYDALNRLTWAGASGTNPCANQAVTGTTLTNASYTASYQYDVSNRLTQSTLTGAIGSDPQGSYTYDSAHYHAADAIGSNAYEAQYDASGNMTCRTPSGPPVCTSSSQTGASLTYDAEGRLIRWVSADGSTTVSYGYDGEGHRFEMQVVTSSATTTTTYISTLEEVTVQGSTTTKIVYFSFGGQIVAEDDNTHWYYPISDDLTSNTVEVDYTGVIAAQLFAPYGQTRWSGGTMPTSYAFTGQRSDSATGLDYYGARYYDPVSGCFTSADTVLAGLNRYAYVAGNPETLTDPSGHMYMPGKGPSYCRYSPDEPDCQGGSSPGKTPPPVGKKCGGYDGNAYCSKGGIDVNSCLGKHHCVILVDGGPDGGTHGLDWDIRAWQNWINAIYAKYGGDVGFILFETTGADADSGVTLIHQTLQRLAAWDYAGNITLVGQSAGAAALFKYLNAKDSGQYAGDAQISSFVAVEAPYRNPSVDCEWCGPKDSVIDTEEADNTNWNGETSGAADYVTKHHIKGLYAWDADDPISDEIDGPWDLYGITGGSGSPFQNPGKDNAHTYLEYNGCSYCLDYIS